MAIFPYIETYSVEQVSDKLRINATKSYTSKDEAEVSLVEIEPEAGNGYIIVTGSSFKDWYLDWEYATDGDKVISVRITTDGAPIIKTKTLTVVTAADDHLFSQDEDLKMHETDMLKYVPKGRSSFKYVHRESQTQILEYLYRIGITDTQGDRLTKEAVIDVSEVKEWSRFMTLQFIYSDLSTTPLDFFAQKSEKYKGWALEARHKSQMKLDLNGDGNVTAGEGVDITHRRMIRV